MAIEKIISGGQTGADRAALDAAIKMGIPHFGWVPKGRLAEDGPIPDTYNLREIPTENYAARTEQNVLDSDGTLILSHGDLIGGSKLTQDLANDHHRPCLHIDLNKTTHFAAASDIYDWIVANNIRTLNIAGPRASGDPDIYKDTMDIIEGVILLDMVGANPENEMKGDVDGISIETWPDPPKTVDEAIEILISEMSLKDKVTIANMGFDELGALQKNLGRYIIDKFRLVSNDELIRSCRFVTKKEIKTAEDASAAIIKILHEKLRNTHRLKVVK